MYNVVLRYIEWSLCDVRTLSGLTPLRQATVGMMMSIGTFPWVIKPLYGFLSDTVPLFGYRRRSYLVVCGLLGETEC